MGVPGHWQGYKPTPMTKPAPLTAEPEVVTPGLPHKRYREARITFFVSCLRSGTVVSGHERLSTGLTTVCLEKTPDSPISVSYECKSRQVPNGKVDNTAPIEDWKTGNDTNGLKKISKRSLVSERDSKRREERKREKR